MLVFVGCSSSSLGQLCVDSSMIPTDKMVAQLQASYPHGTVFQDGKKGLVEWVSTSRVTFSIKRKLLPRGLQQML